MPPGQVLKILNFYSAAEAKANQEKQAAAEKEAAANRRQNRSKQNEEEEITEAESTDVKGVRFAESPPYIKFGTMRDYQVRGLNWMIG